jgi:hypothetical protein
VSTCGRCAASCLQQKRQRQKVLQGPPARLYLVFGGGAQDVKEKVDAVVVDASDALKHDNFGCFGTEGLGEKGGYVGGCGTVGEAVLRVCVYGEGGAGLGCCNTLTAAVMCLAEELLLEITLLLQRPKGIVIVLLTEETDAVGGETERQMRGEMRERER